MKKNRENFAEKFSGTLLEKEGFVLKKANHTNLDEELKVRSSNQYFYKATRDMDGMELTEQNIIEERYILPEGVDVEKQHYNLLFRSSNPGEKEECIGVLALVLDYPDEDTLYVEWMMLKSEYHHLGLGKNIMNVVYFCGREFGYDKIRLTCFEANEKGFVFWKKQGFEVVGETTKQAGLSKSAKRLMIMEKKIKA